MWTSVFLNVLFTRALVVVIIDHAAEWIVIGANALEDINILFHHRFWSLSDMRNIHPQRLSILSRHQQPIITIRNYLFSFDLLDFPLHIPILIHTNQYLPAPFISLDSRPLLLCTKLLEPRP